MMDHHIHLSAGSRTKNPLKGLMSVDSNGVAYDDGSKLADFALNDLAPLHELSYKDGNNLLEAIVHILASSRSVGAYHCDGEYCDDPEKTIALQNQHKTDKISSEDKIEGVKKTEQREKDSVVRLPRASNKRKYTLIEEE